jgi:hypothetical protein
LFAWAGVQSLHYRKRTILVVARFGAIGLNVHAGDHRPPRFHMVGPDFQRLVRLSDLGAMEGPATPGRIVHALARAKENRDVIAAAWARLNERES